jgi:phosphate transport system permease protein
LWTVVRYGIERFDGDFLSYTMRGMDAGGSHHAIIGTLELTLFAR